VRRELVAQLQVRVLNGTTITGAGMVTHHARRPFAWSEVQLTPELMFDPSLSGLAVVYRDVTRLKAALRAQVTAVRGLAR
jgi:hypothetical protein